MPALQNSDRKAARLAVVDWLTNGNISGLDHVYAAYPMRLDLNVFASGDFQCIAVVSIDSEGELRFGIGGALSGKKRTDYLVQVELYHRSTLPDPEAALDHFDGVIDAVKARLREDRMLGQTDDSIVWQAGEGGYGIQTEFAYPDNNSIGGEPLELYARIRFEVTQWITH